MLNTVQHDSYDICVLKNSWNLLRAFKVIFELLKIKKFNTNFQIFLTMNAAPSNKSILFRLREERTDFLAYGDHCFVSKGFFKE